MRWGIAVQTLPAAAKESNPIGSEASEICETVATRPASVGTRSTTRAGGVFCGGAFCQHGQVREADSALPWSQWSVTDCANAGDECWQQQPPAPRF